MLFALLIALAATSGTARVTHVKQQLIKAEIPKEYSALLFADKRLKIYPASVVPRVKAEPKKFSANILEIQSIQRGKDFVKTYRGVLENAEAVYGVPMEDLVALMRIETNLGTYLGELTVFNVFYTRLVTSPESKWNWDAANLISLGKYCYEAQIDCYSLKGSNAGAFGIPQFLPYSIEKWGVDGDNDGVVNLFDARDSIPSAANFLKEHGFEEDRAGALARYYGSGKTYPATVIGYSDALRDSLAIEEQNEKASSIQEKAPSIITSLLTKLHCVFSSLPYCKN